MTREEWGKALDRMRDEQAERHAWDEGTPHTKRDKPAWEYSIWDFQRGADSRREQMLDLIEAIDNINNIGNTDWPDRIFAAKHTANQALEKLRQQLGVK